MFMITDPVLECQTCGEVVRKLSLAESQEVSYNPYAFIVYCSAQCRDDDLSRF